MTVGKNSKNDCFMLVFFSKNNVFLTKKYKKNVYLIFFFQTSKPSKAAKANSSVLRNAIENFLSSENLGVMNS